MWDVKYRAVLYGSAESLLRCKLRNYCLQNVYEVYFIFNSQNFRKLMPWIILKPTALRKIVVVYTKGVCNYENAKKVCEKKRLQKNVVVAQCWQILKQYRENIVNSFLNSVNNLLYLYWKSLKPHNPHLSAKFLACSYRCKPASRTWWYSFAFLKELVN